jgi:hypothetical protein
MGFPGPDNKFRRRVPDDKRMAWAKAVVADMKGRTIAANQREVYALEQVYLHDEPQRELVLQALRVGDLGITAIPNEVYGITGLKLKAQSPLEPTLNIELANGAEGYIPPPEQHKLGGYTTWPARTAGLEVEAEPRIVETLLEQDVPAICGDITDPYIQEQVNLESASLIISTVPDYKDNLILLDMVKLKSLNRRHKPKLVFMAQDEDEIRNLYEKDIDYVVSPHFIGGLHLTKILEESGNLKGLKRLKEKHLKIIGNNA